MSGDFRGWDRALTALFLAQLAHSWSGAPLINVADKTLGCVPAPDHAPAQAPGAAVHDHGLKTSHTAESNPRSSGSAGRLAEKYP
jgi:hypothetical protein